MIDITINGVKCKVLKGTKILKAATTNCFNIPTLCNKPMCSDKEDLINDSRCGVCVVQVTLDGQSELLPSCCTDVQPKMIINTLCESVVNERKIRIQGLKSW